MLAEVLAADSFFDKVREERQTKSYTFGGRSSRSWGNFSSVNERLRALRDPAKRWPTPSDDPAQHYHHPEQISRFLVNILVCSCRILYLRKITYMDFINVIFHSWKCLSDVIVRPLHVVLIWVNLSFISNTSINLRLRNIVNNLNIIFKIFYLSLNCKYIIF